MARYTSGSVDIRESMREGASVEAALLQSQ